MREYLLFTLLLNGFFAAAQDTSSILRLDTLPAQGILLNKGWKFQAGDNPEWANSEYDDSRWENINNPTRALYYLPQVRKEPIGWFRIKLHIDSSLLKTPLAFQVYQSIASEIYLNGELLKRYGTVSRNEKEVKAYNPIYEPVGLKLIASEQVLAVRFSVQRNLPYLKSALYHNTFNLRINDVEGAGQFNRIGNRYPVFNSIYIGIFIVLTIIHFGFFHVFRKQKANLFFSFATLSGAISHALWIKAVFAHSVSLRLYTILFDWLFLLTFFNLFLFIAVHQLFIRKRNASFWLIVGYSLGSVAFWPMFHNAGEILAFVLPFIISISAALSIAWRAYRKGHRDARIIVTGLAAYLILYSLFFLIYYKLVPNAVIGFGSDFLLMDAVYQVTALSVPIALSFYLARDFAFTSKELENKLIEIQRLSAEKQQILISQNETLEQQVTQRTKELKRSLEEIKAMQAQLVQQENKQAIERERLRISAELHDDVGGELSAIRLLSEISIPNISPQQRLSKISASSGELVQKMNEIVWALNANNDSLQSLVAYMRRYAVKYLDDSGIRCRFEHPVDLPNFPIDGATRRNIFLLVKEALHNVVKHAGAQNVSIRVALGKQLALTIHDDGKGIGASQLERSAGNGLRNMRQRVKDLGGQMSITNASGTLLSVLVLLLKNHTKV